MSSSEIRPVHSDKRFRYQSPYVPGGSHFDTHPRRGVNSVPRWDAQSQRVGYMPRQVVHLFGKPVQLADINPPKAHEPKPSGGESLAASLFEQAKAPPTKPVDRNQIDLTIHPEVQVTTSTATTNESADAPVATKARKAWNGVLIAGTCIASILGLRSDNDPRPSLQNALNGQKTDATVLQGDKGFSGLARPSQDELQQQTCINACLMCLDGRGTLDGAGKCTCSNGSVISASKKNACIAGPGSNSSGSGIPTETKSNGQVSPECPKLGDYAYMGGDGQMHYCGSRTDPNLQTTAIATSTPPPLPTPTPNAPPTNNQTRSEEVQHPTRNPSTMDSDKWKEDLDKLAQGYAILGISAVLAVSAFVLNQLGIFRFAKRLSNEGLEGIARTSIEGTIRNKTASSGEYQLNNLPTAQERYRAAKYLNWFQKRFGNEHIKQLETNRDNELKWEQKRWDDFEKALDQRERVQVDTLAKDGKLSELKQLAKGSSYAKEVYQNLIEND